MNDRRLVPGSLLLPLLLLLRCCLVIVYWTADGRVLGGLPWTFKGEITLYVCVCLIIPSFFKVLFPMTHCMFMKDLDEMEVGSINKRFGLSVKTV